MTTFAVRLRQLRTERGWTQGRLAAKASLYTMQVSAYERGVCMPRGKALAQLAAALDVTRDELIGIAAAGE